MSSTEEIPFVDLYAQYLAIKPEIDGAIADVIRKSAFIRGHHVEQFEEEFARAIGQPYCVSCANGTDGLYIAMKALGVRAGDEVLTTAHSWISTSETITQAGAQVVFCDTTPSTYTIDPSEIEKKITERTVGIIPVHLFGQPADMGRVMAIAEKHRLWVIEDCAQGHLATFKGKQVGTFGKAATFSFYPGKNLGAMGDAGAIVTGDQVLARQMAMFARHGGLTKGDHQIEGINSRMDGIQAAVLSVKLRHLPAWTQSRQALAAEYNRQLASMCPNVVVPHVPSDRTHVYHLYVIQHPHRDRLQKHLKDHGIQTVINYPVALPFLPAYARLGHKPMDFPVAYGHQSRIISLPIFPELGSQALQTVVKAIASFHPLA